MYFPYLRGRQFEKNLIVPHLLKKLHVQSNVKGYMQSKGLLEENYQMSQKRRFQKKQKGEICLNYKK